MIERKVIVFLIILQFQVPLIYELPGKFIRDR